ncbi:MAG: amidohydrolase [Bacteroidales bacterium]|nr:amidohydrolase [Bacteroidales bacterium]
MNRLAEIIKHRANEIFNETIDLRRHLHMYPELSYMEKETSLFIARYLKKHKIKYSGNLAGYGLIATIEGRKKGNKVIALRAELDALPLPEESGLDYSSRNKGLMHACGHDAHMAMLMSTAKVINDLRDEFGGTIAFIFQPAEELAPGGAIKLMKTPEFLELNPDLIIAQHVLPELESGKTGFREGIYMASSDELHINIKGTGGHAALPSNSTDQVLAGSELVVELKKLPQQYYPEKPIVIGIGRFIAEGATNIIPEKAEIKGTLRTFDENIRKEMHRRINDTCSRISGKYHTGIDLHIPGGYPVLVNNENFTRASVLLAKEINGDNNVVALETRMSSEDFAHYSGSYPSVFYRLGIAAGKEGRKGLHSPGFTLDEKALETGVRTLTYLALSFTN